MLMTKCRLFVRDINEYSKANSSLEPLTVYKGHTSIVEVNFPFTHSKPEKNAC